VSEPLSSSLTSKRSSVRLSTTVPASLMKALENRAMEEGRSVSNLVAFLLESSLDPHRRD
jgi:hypothetical protein